MTEFYDSARWGLIPAKSHALLYYDGRYRATAQDAKRFSAVRWITVLGGSAAAAHTGAIDWEHGNAAYEGNALRAWAEQRREMNCRARVYCNRSDLPKAHSLVGGLSNVVWWIATLDNKRWTLAELAADVHSAHGVTLTHDKIWAVQFAGGMTAKYDTSILLGSW